jgi:hypothetical protein
VPACVNGIVLRREHRAVQDPVRRLCRQGRREDCPPVSTDRHTHRQTYTQTDIHTDRHTHRRTDAQIDTQTDRVSETHQQASQRHVFPVTLQRAGQGEGCRTGQRRPLWWWWWRWRIRRRDRPWRWRKRRKRKVRSLVLILLMPFPPSPSFSSLLFCWCFCFLFSVLTIVLKRKV